MEVFIGTIMPVGFNYAPSGWALCNGQLLSISQYSALFALLGTTYGGNGQTTFGLPDLRGRVIVGSQMGQAGPGLQPVQPGEMAGTNNAAINATGQASFTLSVNNLPAHAHAANTTLQASTGTTGLSTNATAGASISSTPTGPAGAQMYLPSATPPVGPVALGGVSTTVQNTGNGQAVVAPVATQATTSVMQPYTGINYIIALEGIFPPRP
jgi:microcystin-dependent protein